MSYFTAAPFDSGPPGPLRVTPALGAVEPHAHSCTCAVGADEVREGSMFSGLAIAAAIVGGLSYLTAKTRKRR